MKSRAVVPARGDHDPATTTVRWIRRQIAASRRIIHRRPCRGATRSGIDETSARHALDADDLRPQQGDRAQALAAQRERLSIHRYNFAMHPAAIAQENGEGFRGHHLVFVELDAAQRRQAQLNRLLKQFALPSNGFTGRGREMAFE